MQTPENLTAEQEASQSTALEKQPSDERPSLELVVYKGKYRLHATGDYTTLIATLKRFKRVIFWALGLSTGGGLVAILVRVLQQL